MCVQVTPNIELLFEDVEDPFLQDLEEQQEEDIEEYDQERIDPIKVLDFTMLLIPYVFIIRSTFIYVNTYTEAFFLTANTLIYGMIITINQLHNKKTKNYWIFVLFTGFVLQYEYFILIYIVPHLIQYRFNEKNMIVAYLVDSYGLIVGNNLYWTFITWIWFVISSQFYRCQISYNVNKTPFV
jgi:hypothetical protein